MEEKIEKLINKFQDKVEKIYEPKTTKDEFGELDDIYDAALFMWRRPGMGNSIQIICGDKVSILTLTAGYLTTLINKGIVDIDELEHLIGLVKVNSESVNK